MYGNRPPFHRPAGANNAKSLVILRVLLIILAFFNRSVHFRRRKKKRLFLRYDRRDVIWSSGANQQTPMYLYPWTWRKHGYCSISFYIMKGPRTEKKRRKKGDINRWLKIFALIYQIWRQLGDPLFAVSGGAAKSMRRWEGGRYLPLYGFVWCLCQDA